MLKDFYIPRLSNDMKITVQKNNLRGQIWYRSLDHVKKTASISFTKKYLENFKIIFYEVDFTRM